MNELQQNNNPNQNSCHICGSQEFIWGRSVGNENDWLYFRADGAMGCSSHNLIYDLPTEVLEGFFNSVKQAAPLQREGFVDDSSYMTASDMVVDGGYMNV